MTAGENLGTALQSCTEVVSRPCLSSGKHSAQWKVWLCSLRGMTLGMAASLARDVPRQNYC